MPFPTNPTLRHLLHLTHPPALEGVTARDLAHLIARFACNNHTICNDELQPRGVGSYPTTSMVNHSCIPNAVQSFRGGTIELR
jgi:hypothetical protein